MPNNKNDYKFTNELKYVEKNYLLYKKKRKRNNDNQLGRPLKIF